VGDRLRNVGNLALGCAPIAFLLLFLYGAYVFAEWVWKNLTQADPQVGAAIAGAAVTIVVSIVAIVWGRGLERRATALKELREKRGPVYEDLLKFLFRVLTAARQSKSMSPKEVEASLTDFTQRLLVWGSDSVVAAWSRFRQNTSGDAREILPLVESLIATIRLDLGHLNENLGPGDLLSLFVVDVKEFMLGKST
jgi:hypothetical protein